MPFNRPVSYWFNPTRANVQSDPPTFPIEQRIALLGLTRIAQQDDVVGMLRALDSQCFGVRRPVEILDLISAAGRARIAAVQKARWAKARANGNKTNVVAMPKKRRMSVAARKKIAAAQRARWAKAKAAKG